MSAIRLHVARATRRASLDIVLSPRHCFGRIGPITSGLLADICRRLRGTADIVTELDGDKGFPRPTGMSARAGCDGLPMEGDVERFGRPGDAPGDGRFGPPRDAARDDGDGAIERPATGDVLDGPHVRGATSFEEVIVAGL